MLMEDDMAAMRAPWLAVKRAEQKEYEMVDSMAAWSARRRDWIQVVRTGRN